MNCADAGRWLFPLLALAGACVEPAAPPPRPPAPRASTAHAVPSGAAAPAPTAIGSAAPPAPAEPASPVVEEASAPSSPLRYVPAKNCPLTYDYRVAHRTETLGSGFSNGFDILAQLEGQPEPTIPARFRMKVLWTRRDTIGTRGSFKGARTDDNQTEVLLATDGARWTLAPQWPMPARPAEYDNVANVFPALPNGVAPGSESAWRPPVTGSNALPAVGTGPLTTEPVPIKISRWVRIGGELACELEGVWGKEKSSEERGGGQRVLRRVATRGAARFLVLASGRLLTSEIHQSSDTFTAVQDEKAPMAAVTPPSEFREDVSSELRLVRACSGVTLPPIHPPPTPDERAMTTFMRFREAVARGDRSAVSAFLAPSLGGTTGREAVAGAIVDFQKRFGPSSLGFSGAPRTTPSTQADRISFPVTGFATGGPSGRSARMTVVVVVERKGDDYWIRSLRATVNGPGSAELLDVSETRTFIAEPSAITPPPPPLSKKR